ncbi:LEAF RUST 10 DISEASE-RESISTANCE LOCUS RECEPTOR-LIKE PROTEIN KINASE-like 1.3 [Dioscorea cayenensis subsp. rotundata]|uniref:LEAF RUST 10 DISEASE-RESISTANCE LOCUS RECEPTOR-LIKE PROTEIN KINASE-like 1.3 n=1 Tax=Dioscorea cayennensis subsp. rotundata TaxID=55577 RepID=A0AB40CJZ4_DIOCR|nr:LEAF RUST 10 DISEASE-RESISTANCE LOCUS RECEPTOR-LIKE PROTEIN KINASE-like 1.3 [Dioscorea cayenensis subsp. rotundata]
MGVITDEEEEEEEEKKKMKTMLVGVTLDTRSRELLTWSLVKLALPGDHVIALHVLPSSFDKSDSNVLLSLAKDFDAMLGVYEGFCNLKQIDLKLKICRGPSIRKALIREVNCFGAAKLILGVALNPRVVGPSSTSIAKYCAKKVARECSVFAVSNGKIIFQKEAAEIVNRTQSSECSLVDESEVDIISIASHLSSNGLESVNKNGSNCGSIEIDEASSSQSTLQEENCSICAHDCTSTDTPCHEPKEEDLKKPEALPEGPEVKSGWQFVQKVLLNDKKIAPKDRPKKSMVSWPKRLLNRNSNHKLNESEVDGTSNIDKDSASVSSCSSDTIENVGDVAKELESLREKYSPVCRLFSYKELMHATSNFSTEKLIGKGGSSKVYKGCLADGKELAVKILKPSANAVREFISEIEIINTLHHKNIISLYGFCFENSNLILVYDFFSRGSLEEILHGNEVKTNTLNWAKRYKVAIGVAEALDYLHSGGVTEPIIHRDIKSSNILLSDDFESKLSDFGFAKLASSSTSHTVCDDVAGTFGYLAPEYFMFGKVNEKIDVYAFGVVLLELLSGKKPINTGCPKGQESLVMWAKPVLQGEKVKQLVDPCLGNEYDTDQMERVALAASLCIRQASRSRPQIAIVLKLLQGDDDIMKWAKSEAKNSTELDGLDDEAARLDSNIKSHLTLALHDLEDDSLSVSSTELTFDSANTSLDEYLRRRCSRSLSFD